MAKDTGHGATISLPGLGFTGCIRSIGLPEWVMEKIDASCLDSVDFFEYVFADLSDAGDVTMTVAFDPEVALPAMGKTDTLTITWPISNPANNTAATLVGSGAITSLTLPTLETNTLQEMTIVFSFDGQGQAPTFTPEATV